MATPVSIPNPVMDRMRAGQPALGMTVRLGHSGDIIRIAKATGHDFVFIDVQHSLFNLETIGHMAQVALGCGIAAQVRVRSVDDPNVSVYLDNGVTGIVFPDVNNAEEAQRAVNAAKFAPIGKRSVCGGYPHFDYAAVPLTQSVPALNDAAKRSSNCGLVPFVRKIVSSTPLLHASSATSCNIVCNIFNSFCATTGICRNSNWSTCRRALALRNSKSSLRQCWC